MAFSVPNTLTAGTVIEAADLNDNFSAIENKINGGLTGADLSSSAGIANSQLANDDFVFTVNLSCTGTQWNAVSAGDRVAVSALPYFSTDSFKVIGYTWYCGDVGNQGGVFSVKYGYFLGNTYTNVATIASGVTLPGVTPTTDELGFGGASVDVTCATSSSNPRRFFVLTADTIGTNVLNVNAGVILSVTLLLKRVNGLGTF